MLVYTTILLTTTVESLAEADKWFSEIEKALQGKTNCDMHGKVKLQDENVKITKTPNHGRPAV